MKNYKLTIIRRANKDANLVEQTYEFHAGDREILSIMDALEYIYQNLDSTLSFFHHAACHQAACGKCLVRVNGKTVLACKERCAEGETLIEPVNDDRVICDLICS